MPTNSSARDRSAQHTGATPAFACPVSGSPLRRDGQHYVSAEGKRYEVRDGIVNAFVEDEEGIVTRRVRDFYEETTFPNYNDFDTYERFQAAARASVFARLLGDQISTGAYVLEVGCGTGQLANYLAGAAVARVFAADMSLASLKLGTGFARQNDIPGIQFAHMNLLRPCFLENSMDIVVCNGVLHHTDNPRRGLQRLAELALPGGHIVIGLYNKWGRLPTDLRRLGRRIVGDTVLYLDAHLRKAHSPEKRRAWIRDQYEHPHESKHTFSEVLGWLEDAGLSFVSSIPKIHGALTGDENLFATQDPGRPSDRLITELEMMITGGAEGGLFVIIARKT